MRPTWFVVVVFVFTWSLTTHGKYSVSGDEPHYLMITHSLVTDGDLDLRNNYANNDGRFFGHSNLDQGLHAVPARDGRMLSIHDVGLAVAVIPVYAVARQVAAATSEPLLARFRMSRGLFTYSIVSLSLVALTTVGMLLLAIGLGTYTGDRHAVWLVLLAAISPPVLSHSFLVFPEVLALFVTCVTVWWALKKPSSLDLPAMLCLSVLLGLLPWAHHKFLIYTPGLVFVIAWTRWRWMRAQSMRTLTAAMALYLLPQVALHVWTWQSWGTLGGALTTEALPFSLSTLQAGLVGLWIDRQSGLVAYAPIYWLLPACMIVTWRQSWPFLVPGALLYFPAAAFVIGWWAGFAPAARYLVPAIPLLLVPFATALAHPVIRRLTIALCVPQLVLNAVVWQRPRLLWPVDEGNPALTALGPLGRIYEGMLPPIQRQGITSTAIWTAVGLVVVSAGVAAYLRRRGVLAATPS